MFSSPSGYQNFYHGEKSEPSAFRPPILIFPHQREANCANTTGKLQSSQKERGA